MYKQKPVIQLDDKFDTKTYFRRLLGRVKRLRWMIEKRETTVISGIQSQLDEVDEEILKLQLKREKLVLKMKTVDSEIHEIRSEIVEYVEKIRKQRDEEVQPLFQILKRIKKSKVGGMNYTYYEGRIRGRMRRGFKMKDRYKHFGDYRTSRGLVKKRLGIELPPQFTEQNEVLLKKHLKVLLEQIWLEELGM